MKTIIFIFILTLVDAGTIVAHSASSPTIESLSIHDQVFERVIDERLVDRLGLFDRPDDGAGRYDISLDLENEDGDWSFEVTVTMEF